MDLKERPAIVAILGLALLFVSAVGTVLDLSDIADGLRKLTGLNWQRWNVVGMAIGLSMVVWGLYTLKHFRADAGAKSPQEGKKSNIFERFILTPFTYPIIWLQIYKDWSFSDHEDSPMGILKRLIFIITVSVLGISAFSLLFALMVHAMANVICLFDQVCVYNFVRQIEI